MKGRGAGYRNLLIPTLMAGLCACQAPPPEKLAAVEYLSSPEFREHNLPFSEAVRVDRLLYLSGQIGLDPASGQLVEGIDAQIHRVFANLAAVATAAGLGLDRAVRMTVYLTDLGNFAKVNEIMAQYVGQPYPSRAAVGVASLPRGALVEVDCILYAG